MYIYTENMFRPELKYVPFGTIGYVKTINNEVRQCKCLGAKWELGKDSLAHVPTYEWKVAGIKEHQFGSASRLAIGIIYKTEIDAQKGGARGATKIGELYASATFPIFNYLINKYGMSVDCFECIGAWSHCLHISTYLCNKDHTVSLCKTDFEVLIDENGIDCRIPMLEGVVNGVRRYPTAEKAYAAMKPLKTYSLDDDVAPTPTKIKVTIEVEIDDIDKVKKYATILE